ncbi:MAG: glycoside hydrolase family 3 C-terminal domain-containing protein [Melioribacteraceae bacterium]|nr:glycoside hydrolase family 3 C-terminal domain-containing protein [Melioribacteraceae bacterium]
MRNILSCLLLVLFFPAFPLSAQNEIYKDSTKTVFERVEDLLARMTLAEKVGQMTQVDLAALSNPESIINYSLGSILSGGSSDPSDNYPETWANKYDELQSYALSTRLGIPIIYGVDAVHGHNNVIGAVIFPHNIGLGCTRNPDLIKEIGRITALEVAATGIDWTFAPCIAVPRDDRWGRTYEGFGETPELAELGSYLIEGLQGDSLADHASILACAKHFVGDGGTQGGVDQGDTQISESELRQIHLPGYISAIEKGVGSVMASFSSWNGDKLHGSKYLLTDVLKNELGFKGFVISDWAGIDQLSGDLNSDVAVSINAGIDMVMVPNDFVSFTTALKEEVNSNNISIDRIDDAVKRILIKKFELGLFESPFTNKNLMDSLGSKSHREIGRQAVRESLVLLKKKDGILPLSKTPSKILLAGSHADNLGFQCGGWTIDWQGGSGNITEGTTIRQAIQKAIQSGNVEFSEEGDFVEPLADYSIVVIGEKPYAEGDGDKEDLSISRDDVALIKKMKSYGNPVVVILMSGRPMILKSILHYSDIIIAAWLPGTEGSGVTDILFGDYFPTGKLSVTWPETREQNPINFGDLDYNPLFEYGYGILSLDDTQFGSTPIFYSAIVSESGTSLELTFNKPIDKNSLADATFTIFVNGNKFETNYSTDLKDQDSTTILLNLNNKIAPQTEVKVNYTAGNIKSIDGGIVQSFVDYKVMNESKKAPRLVPGIIEAEDFNEMFGVEIDSLSSGDGTYVLLETGDWIETEVNVATGNNYLVYLRYSTNSGSAKISMQREGTNVFRRNLAPTFGVDLWETATQVGGFPAGTYTLRITAEEGFFKLNWFGIGTTSSISERIASLPDKFELHQNYPNPFNPTTTIKFNIPVITDHASPAGMYQSGQTTLRVFNPLGEQVAELLNQELESGFHSVEFDASRLASGIYFYKLTSGEFNQIRKMILMK